MIEEEIMNNATNTGDSTVFALLTSGMKETTIMIEAIKRAIRTAGI